MNTRFSHKLTTALLCIAMVGICWGQEATIPAEADPAAALGPDSAEPPPDDLKGMDVAEKLDEQIPLDLTFENHVGEKVRLSQYFDGERPVVLTLNYYRCPMLCGLTLNALCDGLEKIDWTAGDKFRILTVSFDPLETPDLAHLKRQSYLTRYGRPAAARGWDFLVGDRQNIRALLDATGFPVRWNDKRKEYIHPAALIVLTPDGRISRYLYGVYYEPKTLRLSLVEASQGKIGSTIDKILLFCYHYDPEAGSYALAAMNLVRAVGILTLIVLGSALMFLWRKERQREPVAPADEGPETT